MSIHFLLAKDAALAQVQSISCFPRSVHVRLDPFIEVHNCVHYGSLEETKVFWLALTASPFIVIGALK